MDNALIISEVKQSCLHPVTPEPSCDNKSDDPSESPERTYAWKPLLLFISLRLGLSEINPVYKAGLKKCFSLPSSLGVIGGSPNHALYLLGCVDDEVQITIPLIFSNDPPSGSLPGPAHHPGVGGHQGEGD